MAATTEAYVRHRVSDDRVYWADQWDRWRVEIRTKAAVATSLSSNPIVAGSSSTITITTSNANPVYHAVTITPTSNCAGLSFTPASVTFSAGQVNPSSAVVISSNGAMASSTCTITYTHTANPQWQDAITSDALTVYAKITLSIPTWTPTMSCGEDYTFVVEASGFVSSGSATITPTCGTATINAVAGTQLTSTIKTLSYTINAVCVTTYSCTLALAATGAGATQLDTPYPTKAASFTNLKVIGATKPSTTFVGKTIALDFDDAGALTSGQSLTVSWSSTPTNLTNVTSGTVTLTFAEKTKTVYIYCAAAGSITTSFTVDSAPSQYETTMPDRTLTINPLKTVAATPAAIATNLSVGYTLSLIHI